MAHEFGHYMESRQQPDPASPTDSAIERDTITRAWTAFKTRQPQVTGFHDFEGGWSACREVLNAAHARAVAVLKQWNVTECEAHEATQRRLETAEDSLRKMMPGPSSVLVQVKDLDTIRKRAERAEAWSQKVGDAISDAARALSRERQRGRRNESIADRITVILASRSSLQARVNELAPELARAERQREDAVDALDKLRDHAAHAALHGKRSVAPKI